MRLERNESVAAGREVWRCGGIAKIIYKIEIMLYL